MGKFIKSLLMGLMLLGFLLWGTFALYFGDSRNDVIQTSLALSWGLYGLATLFCLGLPRWRKRLLMGFAISFGAILAWWFWINPSNERQWQPDVAKLAYANFEGDHVTVHNIGNFDNRGEYDYQPAYYSKTFE